MKGVGERTILLFLICFISGEALFAQFDTILLKGNEMLLFQDSVFLPQGNSDTSLILPSSLKYRVKKNPYLRSENFYQNLQEKSKKGWFREEAFRLLVANPGKSQDLDGEAVRAESFFEPFAGRKIGRIRLVRVPLFGGSILDTTLEAHSSFIQFLDRLYVPTSRKVLKRKLKVETGEIVDPYVLADEERIIRSLPYIEDTRIEIAGDTASDEPVELILITKDRLPYGVTGGFGSFEDFSVGLAYRNLMGVGTEVYGTYIYRKDKLPVHGYESGLRHQNLGGALIDLELIAANNWREERYSGSLERPFLLPNQKWGGGLALTYLSDTNYLSTLDTTFYQPFSLQGKDVWVGNGLSIGKDERTVFNTGLRFVNLQFQNRPEVLADSNILFQNRKSVIGGLSFSRAQFLKSNYILAFGITEDIPYGFRVSLFPGIDFNEFDRSYYLGADLGASRYFPRFGFAGLRVESGLYWNKSSLASGILRTRFVYYSPLAHTRRWKHRFFFTFFAENGMDVSEIQQSDLRESIRDIQGDNLTGEQTLALRLESISFPPWFFIGFQFAPYGYFELGFVRETRFPTSYAEWFPSTGVGLRIRNESLVVKTLDIRCSYFFQKPEGGSHFGFFVSVSRPIFIESMNRFKPEIIELGRVRFL